MSRVPSPENKEIVVNFRATTKEKAVWDAEADRQGVSLSRLVRHVLNDYVKSRNSRKKKTR